MNLYQRRSFGALFNDSFKFLKTHFKHLYGNFFKIIGLFTIAFLILLYVGSRYFEVFYSNNLLDEGTYNVNSLPGGIAVTALLIGLTVLVAIIISAIVYTYTPIYFLLYREYGTDFTNKDIIATYKKLKWRILKFLLVIMGFGLSAILLLVGLGFLIVTLVMNGGAAIIVLFFLFMLLVFFAALIIVPYVTLSIYNGYMEYLSSEMGVMECLRYGFQLTKSSFWKNVGTVLLYTLLIRIVLSIVLAIPFYILLFGTMMTGIDAAGKFMFTAMFWNYASQFISNYMIAPILQTNLSMVYFSNKEESEQINSFNELDEIGKIN